MSRRYSQEVERQIENEELEAESIQHPFKAHGGQDKGRMTGKRRRKKAMISPPCKFRMKGMIWTCLQAKNMEQWEELLKK